MARWGSVIAVGAMSVLAACSSSGDSAPPDPTNATAPAPTSTEATTTTISPPTTTDAPTTTVDPATTLAAEVEADFLEAFSLANEALQDPFSAEKEAAALERRTGFASGALAAKLEEYRTRNRAIRVNPDIEASMTVEKPAELVVEGGDVAELQACEVDPWILVEVGAGPNGSDSIVEPNVFAYRSTIFLRSIEGVWRVEGGSEVASWEGLDECPPEE